MKNDIINKFFQKKEQLTLANDRYQKLVHDLIVWLLESDQVTHDATTKALFSKEQIAKARIITRQQITVAGLEEIIYLIQTFTTLQYTSLCKDGDRVEAGQLLIEIQGNIKEILAFERIILNILQRLSGIATETNNIISQIKQLTINHQPFIAATRKTIWGLLDKKAVAMGGGLTHRLDLSDGILVKDNHLMLISASDALQTLLKQVENTLIEIEVEDEQTLKQLVTLFTQTTTDNVLAILLDNFSPEKAKNVLSQLSPQPNIIFEASGGITDENIIEWAGTGVDIISLGALTHSSKAADLSLEI